MAEKVDSALAVGAVGTSWTPRMSLQTAGTSSFAYTNQAGVYVKIGSLIVANFTLSVSTFTVGTGSGGVFLDGLPAEIAVSSPLNGYVSQYTNITLPTSYTQLALEALWLSSGNTKCSLAASGSAQNGSSALLGASALPSAFLLAGCVIYQTDT